MGYRSIRPRRVGVAGMLALGLATAPAAGENLIHTIAGTGNAGSTTDGMLATQAPLDNPQGVAVGSDGVVYISDSYNHAVREVDASGAVRTIAEFSVPLDLAVAPNGDVIAAGFANVYRITPAGEVSALLGSGHGDTGDGGLAINATVMSPQGVAVDSSGNIYFTDTGAHRVRKIDVSGVISTVAGTGIKGNSGDNGPATSANLSSPYDVAVGPNGRLYIADTGNARLRIVEPDGRIWTTLATSAGVWFVESDAEGRVYFGSRSRGEVRRLDADLAVVAGQIFTGYAGDGGPAVDARLSQPRRIAFDPAGNLLIAEEGNHVVRKVVMSDHSTRRSDMDGDGWSDILWRNDSTGANVGWLTGDYRLPYLIDDVTVMAWELQASGDFNGDGTTDLFWRNNQSGHNTIWIAGQSDTSMDVARVQDTGWVVDAVGDFDGDRIDDVLWHHAERNGWAIWLGADASRAVSVESVPDVRWEMVAVGDFNGDGKSDLFWRHRDFGYNTIWLAGEKANQMAVARVQRSLTQVAGAGDFNGDGVSDVLWWDSRNARVGIWYSANAQKAVSLGGVGLAVRAASIADFNGDRMSDVLWRNQVDGTNRIWLSGDPRKVMRVGHVRDSAWRVIP